MKRKIVIVLTIALLSTGFVYAASVNGTFAGLPIVNVIVNGETVKSDVPGVVLQGKTLLPARAIAESLNSLVSWDQATMTATITKPEVNMVFVGEVVQESDGSWTLKNAGLSNDTVGKDKWADIYFETGPMAKQLYSYRIVLLSPDGNVLSTSEVQDFVIDNKGMIGEIYMDNLTFEKTGNYTFQFQMKFNDQFVTVEDAIMVVE
ncbi:MAG TPA: stalk domain-containing protein [Anaerovoracaceae bacterium]|nr:stalk domain-containing protein [Anaerovoracaceae bacterium]